MAWSGGSFTRLGGTTRWADERDAGTEITAASMDTHDNDIVTGINATIAKDGSNAFTGDADLGTQKITNLLAPAAETDGATLSVVAIRQIVVDTLLSDVENGTTTYSASGLEVSITLSYSASRVILLANAYVSAYYNSGTTTGARYGVYEIYRTTGTAAQISSAVVGRNMSSPTITADSSYGNLCLMGTEVPGAGTHTYQVRYKSPVAGVRATVLGSSGTQASMYAIEVKP